MAGEEEAMFMTLLLIQVIFSISRMWRYPGSQRFSKRRATKCDKRSTKRRRERENRQKVRKPLVARDSWLSYRANRFELGSRSDPASWLEEPYRCVVIGCLLIDLVMLIDSYRSMIVRFASPATRGFLSPLLSLSCLVSSRRKKTSGTRVMWRRRRFFNRLKAALIAKSKAADSSLWSCTSWSGISEKVQRGLGLFQTASVLVLTNVAKSRPLK